MENKSFPARLNYVSRSGGPSSFEEGWIRPQFRRMALYTCGEGVVKANSGWLISTTSPKSMNWQIIQDNKLNYMDLGTPPEPGGEMIGSLMKNDL